MEGDKSIGHIFVTPNGLRDLANSLENLFDETHVIRMPLYEVDGEIRMQITDISGPINLIKNKQEIGLLKKE